MPTYTPSLGLTLPDDGDTNWGVTVNTGVTELIDVAIAGRIDIEIISNTITLDIIDGAPDNSRYMALDFFGTLTTVGIVIVPSRDKLYFIRNSTVGGFDITITTTLGTTVNIPNGKAMVVFCTFYDVYAALDYVPIFSATDIGYTGTLTGGTGVVNLGSGQLIKDASGNVGIGRTPTVKLDANGAMALSVPKLVTTSTYTVLVTDSTVRFSVACTVTLPAAASFPGRILRVFNLGAVAVTSASSNVIQQTTGVVGTAILSAVAGKWVDLHSNGSSWYITASN